MRDRVFGIETEYAVIYHPRRGEEEERPTNLALYALFKQATSGDVSGSRPGMLDLRGRAKYDAWAKHKGMTKDAAMQAYIDLVAKHAPVH